MHLCSCIKKGGNLILTGHDVIYFGGSDRAREGQNVMRELCAFDCGTLTCMHCGKESYVNKSVVNSGHDPRCDSSCPECEGKYRKTSGFIHISGCRDSSKRAGGIKKSFNVTFRDFD